MRLNSDFNVISARSSVQQTYFRIINDLKEAVNLLPVVPTFKNRASKPAAYAALARTYLTMQDYVNARLYADSCLQLKNDILDFRLLSITDPNPILEYNPEVIFHGKTGAGITTSRYFVDSTLFNSYTIDDLRKRIFYTTAIPARPKGNYVGTAGSTSFFAGFATNEMYLIRAECAARAGDTTSAMADLNTLLEKRWNANTFTPFVASTAQEALQIILRERRKELVFTLTRWSDLRRLNKESAFSSTIQRVLNGQLYSLAPNSPGYTVQIPKTIIDKTGMQQNP